MYVLIRMRNTQLCTYLILFLHYKLLTVFGYNYDRVLNAKYYKILRENVNLFINNIINAKKKIMSSLLLGSPVSVSEIRLDGNGNPTSYVSSETI